MKTKHFLFLMLSLIAFLASCKQEELLKVTKLNTGTIDPLSITFNSATAKGSFITIGNDVSDFGHCWGTSLNPTTSDFIYTVNGTAQGPIVSYLTNLNENSTYHVRAYAIDNGNPVYGDNVTFKTNEYGLPGLTTMDVTSIGQTTASSGGNVSSDGGTPITAKGVCWSTLENPTIALTTKTNEGSGTGQFTSSITGLKANTPYYLRAYATNGKGTSYGGQKFFTTLPASYISIKSPAKDSLWEMGFIKQIVWEDNISENVKIELLKPGSAPQDIVLSIASNGSYNWSIPESLSGGNNYAIKISNVNNSSICDTSDYFEIFGKISDIEGNKYRIVKIGNQWWMRENLRSTRYADNYQIPVITGNTNWNNLTTDDIGCCYFNDNTSYGSDYGVLYTWVTAMKGNYIEKTQGICPTGWHIPSDAEWKDLEKYLGMSVANADATGWRGNDEGNVLKETGIVHWTSSNGTNLKGFTAMGSGYRTDAGVSNGLKIYASYWVSNYSGFNAWCRQLHNDVGTINRNLVTWLNGYSVRCVKD